VSLFNIMRKVTVTIEAVKSQKRERGKGESDLAQAASRNRSVRVGVMFVDQLHRNYAHCGKGPML
jgi:hypothetical protein